ncbi:hypothetical protein CSIM01_01611 [Colletotrichum simmondsii]|uniref:Cell wall glycoprotein n=1 Tax=Colletotrichum simmondsii TaxID=703756 RepID=A0A135TRR5_9PEZI|nr:hypothetical protein CSIM01_01611 [Colletotrichum simmondsii]
MSSHVAPLLAGLIIGAAQLTSGSPVADAPVVAPVAALLTNGTYTQVVTAITTYCPEPTVIYHGKYTYTIKEPTTFTITDCPCTITHTGPMPTGVAPSPDCPATCAAAYDKCRGAPDANRATCAAEYAGCLGYSPFGPDGSLVTPTACSGTAAVPTGTAVPPIIPGVVPPAMPTAPSGPECAASCAADYDKCRSAPDANRATCAANYAGCLGYSPFGPDGSLVTPTACSGTATAVPPITTGIVPPGTNSAVPPIATGVVPPATCVAGCNDAYNKCRSAPGANMSTCAAQYAGCLGYSPFGPDGSLVTPTACSGSATGAVPTATAKPLPSVVQVASAGRASFGVAVAAVCGLAAFALF